MNEIESGNDEENENGLLPDKGREELILEYQVLAGDRVELPYSTKILSTLEGKFIDANFNFDVDWGDGTVNTGITNSNIAEKNSHIYKTSGTYDIKIKGIYEILSVREFDDSLTERENNKKITKIKQWGTTGIKQICLSGTNITQIANPTQSSFKSLETLMYAFSNCKLLEEIPDNLFANCTNILDMTKTFYGCNKITKIPENLFKDCKKVMAFSGTFENTSVEEIPKDLFKNNTEVLYFFRTFANCKLKSIPLTLFDNCKKVRDFAVCFKNNEDLQGDIPKLWLRIPDGENNGYGADDKNAKPYGSACYNGCTKVNGYLEEIPEFWRRNSDS